ncbi:MAG: hypothetical protein AAF211_33155, partial [Myxococcota bacterium]
MTKLLNRMLHASALFFVLGPAAASAQVVGIDGEGFCRWDTIQDALDDGEHDLVIANNAGALSTGAVWEITNMPAAEVRISGAGPSCLGSGVAILDMSTGASRFPFAKLGSNAILRLEDLEFREGAGSFIWLQSSLAELHTRNVTFDDGSSGVIYAPLGKAFLKDTDVTGVTGGSAI